MSYSVEVLDLTKRYRHQRSLKDIFLLRSYPETLAVDCVSLAIREGEIFGLIGPNGAGKTTLIKVLCTLILPSSGTARILGHDIVREDHRVRRLIGLVTADERSFYWRLTGRQNLGFFASLYGLNDSETARYIAELLEQLGLTEIADLRFDEYSAGMKQKLAIARGLLCRPKVLFLDEPTKGLDPVSARSLLNLIKHKIGGYFRTTIILSTHILSEAEQVCDRVAVLNQGRVIACGGVDEINLGSAELEKYWIRVKGLSAERLREISGTRGVASCSTLGQNNGVLDLEIQLQRNTLALSEVIRKMVNDDAKILTCTLEKLTLEERFHALVKQVGKGGPSLQEGASEENP